MAAMGKCVRHRDVSTRQSLAKIGIGRADRIDARVPACARLRRAALRRRDFQARIAQGAGKRESSQIFTAHNQHIKHYSFTPVIRNCALPLKRFTSEAKARVIEIISNESR